MLISKFFEEQFNLHSSHAFMEGSQSFLYSIGLAGNKFAIVKADSKGHVIWSKSYEIQVPSEQKHLDGVIRVGENLDYNYVITVRGGNKFGLIKVDSEGNLQWSRVIDELLFLGKTSISNSNDPNKFHVVCVAAKTDEPYYLRTLKIHSDGTVVSSLVFSPYKNVEIIRSRHYTSGFTTLIRIPGNSDYVFVCLTHEQVISRVFSFGQKSLVNRLDDFVSIETENANELNWIASGEFDDKSGIVYIDSALCCYFSVTELKGKTAICSKRDVLYLAIKTAETSIVHKARYNSAGQMELIWGKSVGNGTPLPFSDLFFLNAMVYAIAPMENVCVITNGNFQTCMTVEEESQLKSYRTFFAGIYGLSSVTDSVSTKATSNRENTIEILIKLLCEPRTVTIDLDERNTKLQSPSFLLEAVGSTGTDGSAIGNHVRWAFNGTLKDYHLPKGNASANTFHYNKPDDFVQLFRIPYPSTPFSLKLSDPPSAVNHAAGTWVYNFGSKVFHVKFRNLVKYTEVLSSVNPMDDTIGFFVNYKNNLIEVSCMSDSFFSVTISPENFSSSTIIQSEILSVDDTYSTTMKLSVRRTINLQDNPDLTYYCVNGHTFRYIMSEGVLDTLFFDLYHDFLITSVQSDTLEFLGDFALSLDDEVVLTSLEPVEGIVHGKWPHFNGSDKVNLENYIQRWYGEDPDGAQNLKQAVANYLTLSESEDNPLAMQMFPQQPTGDASETGDIGDMVSTLNLLNVVTTDFHLARMMGMGTLDLYGNVADDTYVYVAVYNTLKDVGNPNMMNPTQLIAMSLPTNPNFERKCLPIEIDSILPGLYDANFQLDLETTNGEGYTFDGRTRYLTVFRKDLWQDIINPTFYQTWQEFSRADFTLPVFGGLKHNLSGPEYPWIRPELSHDDYYMSAPEVGVDAYPETIPLFLDPTDPTLYVHEQRISGNCYYNTYGINLFCRSQISSAEPFSIYSELIPSNLLRSPSDISAMIIQYENPPLLTSTVEQSMLHTLSESATDLTLVRLLYEYHFAQEGYTYKVPDAYADFSDTQILTMSNDIFPDNMDLFADDIEIAFRNRIPEVITGKIQLAATQPGNGVTNLQTSPYFIGSLNQYFYPEITEEKIPNFIGGILNIGQEQFIIEAITLIDEYPMISVYNRPVTDSTIAEDGSYSDQVMYVAPQISNDGLFSMVENMQNLTSWGTVYTPYPLKVTVGHPSWTLHKEVVYGTNSYDGNVERFVQKSRGFWNTAVISKVYENVPQFDSNENPILDSDGNQVTVTQFLGKYKAVFPGFQLPDPPQTSNKVTYFKGIIRARKADQEPKDERKIFPVLLYDTTQADFVLYFSDPEFSDDNSYSEVLSTPQEVNFYPGYRVYLFADEASGLNSTGTMPLPDENDRYTILALRSHDTNDYVTGGYFSKFSAPALLYGQRIITPAQPLPPDGIAYATRPDFFGKSTYTFKTTFNHIPYGILFYRSTEEMFLQALYKAETVRQIRGELDIRGGNDEIYVSGNRWLELLYPSENISSFSYFNEYALPMPDNARLIAGINEFIRWHNQQNGASEDAIEITTINSLDHVIIATTQGVSANLTARHFIADVLESTFTPLTEFPVLYKYVKASPFEPTPDKQNLRDRNGNLLKPDHADFRMAPMAKLVGDQEVSFTDFTLDGTSKNLYFYAVREMGSKLQMGQLSRVVGPVKMVNSNPPPAPEVVRAITDNGDMILGRPPAIIFEINTYRPEQHIAKINMYRTSDPAKLESVRNMALVKVVDIGEMSTSDAFWSIKDEFVDYASTPFEQNLYYRFTAQRCIEYADFDSTGIALETVVDVAPSPPSKPLAIYLRDNSLPYSPELLYTSGELSGFFISQVALKWNDILQTKGRYHVFKRGVQGNWLEIGLIESTGNPTIVLPLSDTSLSVDTLQVMTDAGTPLFHHFKVICENLSGVWSKDEKVLTISVPGLDNIDLGVGDMIIGPTFKIR